MPWFDIFAAESFFKRPEHLTSTEHPYLGACLNAAQVHFCVIEFQKDAILRSAAFYNCPRMRFIAISLRNNAFRRLVPGQIALARPPSPGPGIKSNLDAPPLISLKSRFLIIQNEKPASTDNFAKSSSTKLSACPAITACHIFRQKDAPLPTDN